MVALKSKMIRNALGVQDGEGSIFTRLLLANMLIGVARNFAWTAGSALFLEKLGSESQPYLFLLNSVMLPSLAAIYLRLERVFSFRQLMLVTHLGMFGFLIGIRLLIWSSDANWVVFLAGISFDILFFVTGMVYWGLAGMLCDVRQAKRLFPMIGSGEWIVMVVGGFATPWIVTRIGTANMFWIAAAGIGAALVVMLLTLERSGTQESETSGSTEPEASPRPTGNLLKNPFIFFMLFNNALSTLGVNFLDNAYYGLLEKRYTDADQLAGFLGQFWAWIAVIILISRSFLTSRLLARYGVNLGLLALPVFGLMGIAGFLILGWSLGVEAAICFWMLVITRFGDACLRNDLDASAGLILYQPLPAAQKSVAQAMNDGVFVPVATGLAGGSLLLMKKVFGFGPLEIAYTLPPVIIAWIVSGFAVTRRYPSMVAAAIAGHRYDSAVLSLTDSDSLEILKGKLHSNYATEVLYALALLEGSEAEFLSAELIRLLEHPEPEVRREVLRILARREQRDAVPAVRERARLESSSVVRGEALRTLATLEEVDALDELTPYLNDTDPDVRVSAMVGVMQHVGLDGILLAGQRFNEMRNSREPAERALAARVLGEVGIQNFYRPLIPLLRDENVDVRREAVIATGKLKNPKLWPDVLAALDIPGLQSAAVTSLVAGGEPVLPLLETAFDEHAQNPEFQVRVVRVFQQIRGQEVLAFLERHLDITHPDVYSRVLSALSSCQYRVATPDVPRIAEKIREESQQTAWLLAVLQSLSDDEAFALLKDAIEDLRWQHLDRVYLLLSFMHNSQAMFDSRNNLEHPSAERRAYAFELVDSTISRELKPFVLPLIDTLEPAERLRRLNGAPGMKTYPQTVTEHLLEIIRQTERHSTDWMCACAIFAAAKLKISECREAILSAISKSQEPLIRHTAVWALSQIDPVQFRQEISKLAASDVGLQSAVQFLERRAQGAPIMLLDIEKLLILKTVPIFSEAPDHVLAQVVPILEEQEFEAGQRIFEKGDLGTSMYVIVSGKVRIHIDDRELTVLGERQVFGELALLDPEPRSASVTAIEPTLLFKISQNAIYDLMSNHIEIVRGIIRVLCQRIRKK